MLADAAAKTILLDMSLPVERLVEGIGQKMNIEGVEEFSLKKSGSAAGKEDFLLCCCCCRPCPCPVSLPNLTPLLLCNLTTLRRLAQSQVESFGTRS
jgi:hypothetical protein